jgi:hypothetical protein
MLNIEDIAVVCHEVNRAYCAYCASLGDVSQAEWELASDWQHKSAIDGVNFHIANPTALPDDSHNNWLKGKLADGWKYGPVKDPEKKEHPCCVSFVELPQEQKSKDYLFKAVVHSLKHHLGALPA